MQLSVSAMKEPALRKLLPLLDGSRDHAALLSELRQDDPQLTQEGLQKTLATLANYGMLLA